MEKSTIKLALELAIDKYTTSLEKYSKSDNFEDLEKDNVIFGVCHFFRCIYPDREKARQISSIISDLGEGIIRRNPHLLEKYEWVKPNKDYWFLKVFDTKYNASSKTRMALEARIEVMKLMLSEIDTDPSHLEKFIEYYY